MAIIVKFLILLALVAAMIFSGMYLPIWATATLALVISISIPTWLMLFAASADKETAIIPTGEIKFIVEGESCLKVLANLDGTGWFYDDEEKIIREKREGDKYPRSFLGVYWVSILYPLKQIHVWIFEWTKLIKGDPQKKEDTYLLEHRKEYVNSLFLLATYPIHAKSVELEGNLQIDILALVTLRIVNPLIPVFVFKGAYLTLVDAAINGAITDLCRDKTLDKFREMEKEGPGNEFSETIFHLNDSIESREKREARIAAGMPSGGDKKLTPGEGIPEIWGVAIHKVDFISFDLSTEAKEVQEATRAVEVARLEAKADTERGRGIEIIGEATAKAFDHRLTSASKFTGGVEALSEQLKMEGVSTFKGSFLSLGGGQPAPAVVVNPKTPSQPTTEK